MKGDIDKRLAAIIEQAGAESPTGVSLSMVYALCEVAFQCSRIADKLIWRRDSKQATPNTNKGTTE